MEKENWNYLFNGRDLSGWGITGNEEGWVVEDETIKCRAMQGGYLYTEDQFEDFILSVDFKIEDGTNSGVFIRWSNLKDPVHTGIEVQILDCYGKDETNTHSCGALYDMVAPSEIACKPAGEWENMVIRAEGPKIQVEYNEIQVASMNVERWEQPGLNPDGTKNKFKYAWKDMPRKGHIGLQDHNGVIWFREVKIRQL